MRTRLTVRMVGALMLVGVGAFALAYAGSGWRRQSVGPNVPGPISEMPAPDYSYQCTGNQASCYCGNGNPDHNVAVTFQSCISGSCSACTTICDGGGYDYSCCGSDPCRSIPDPPRRNPPIQL